MSVMAIEPSSATHPASGPQCQPAGFLINLEGTISLTTISNISTGGTDLPAAAPAPVPTGVTVIDERHALVVDSAGRRLKIKRLSALDRVRLFRAAGANSENRMLMAYASAAASVVEIDSLPVAFPASQVALDALIGRLDEHGLEAAVEELAALAGPDDAVAAAKNF